MNTGERERRRHPDSGSASLDELPQRDYCFGEARALAAGSNGRGKHDAHGDRIRDEACGAVVRHIDLPITRVLSEEAVRAPLGQMPFHPSLARIRIVHHIETERK